MSGCPLCGSDKTSAVSSRDRRGRRVRTWLCEDCGLVFNSPQARPRALLEAYVEEQDRLDAASQHPEIASTVRIFARMEQAIAEYWPLLRDRRRVLDACAGSGEFTYVMRSLGFEVEALEPNPDYAVYCHRVLGLDVHAHAVFDRSYAPASFDLIRVHHLLVHSSDPIAQLRRLREWLADDGLLYLELPNIEAEAAERPRGDIFDVGHIYSFNPATLRAALAVAGFTEAQETEERHRDTTAGFFRKAAPNPQRRADAANAKRVSDAITRHYNEAHPIRTSIGRFVGGLSARAAERRDLKGLVDPRQAAEHFAGRLKAKLGR
jgi:SAM-dependent methyltransferase